MSVTREDVEDALQKVLHQGNTDYNMGVLATLYYMTDKLEDEEVLDELVTAMVYQQTMKYDRQTRELSGLTRAVAGSIGISNEQLEVAAKKVQEYVKAEYEARQEAANETQRDDSH